MLTKRYFLLLILLLGGMTSTVAQNIVVQGFRLDEKDLTANTAGTTVIDPNNGQKCALIKIETIQTGFTFDVGMLGVVKTEQHPGEVWVYVPEGVKRITITHPQLGILRDHDLGMTLKRAKTYIMRLVTGDVQTTVRQARTSQFVVFTLEPQNAVVRLDGNMLSTTDGTAQKYMPFGTYDYTVEAPDYHSEVGKVTVNDPRNKHIVNIRLRPNFSRVTLTVDNNAEIWVNGERKGTGSWTGNLGAGVYMLETRLANHRFSSRQAEIVVTAEPQTIRLDAPTPILGEANIGSTPALADIFVDGKKVGQTPIVVPDLLIGQHTVKVTKQGYADYETQITVSEGQTADVSATLKKGKTPVVAAADNGGVSSLSGNVVPITVKGVTFNMVRVKGGTFQMGATSEQISYADGDEKPAHSVTLSDYYIGQTEVTQALWKAIMGTNPSKWKGKRLPVETVSWDDCQTFIQKLNQLTGRRFRLPTEAEWEYAARGGNQSRGYKYSGGNTLDGVAWYDGNSGGKTHDVGTKQANELGLYDMSGNVWEWCQDWYGRYGSLSQTNPTGPYSGSNRVYRGGGWFFSTGSCRVSNRNCSSPSHRSLSPGLRLAL